MPEFNAHKKLEEANELREHGAHGARWVPIVAAVLAVVAAVASLLANQRSSIAVLTKNDAVLQEAKASDAFNFYQAKSIKQHIYDGLAAAGVARTPEIAAKLKSVAKHENTDKKPILEEAKKLEEDSRKLNEKSEKALHSFETIEVAVTLFEVALVLVSISAIVTTSMLTIVIGTASGIGLIVLLVGLFM